MAEVANANVPAANDGEGEPGKLATPSAGLL